MSYHVGNIAKTSSRLAFTVEEDGVGYHIAECRFRSSAELICKALNQCNAGSTPAKTQEKQNHVH